MTKQNTTEIWAKRVSVISLILLPFIITHSFVKGQTPIYTTLDSTTTPTDTSEVYDVVEQMPDFPGGHSALLAYINKNLRTPNLSEICGDDFQCMLFNTRTIVRFVVTRNGNIRDAQAMKNPGGALSDSIIKIVESMPRWIPGMQDGAPVDVYFTIPMHLDFRSK